MTLPRRWLSWRSLRVRITLAMVGLTLGLGVIALFHATSDLKGVLEERLEDHGVAIARDLAFRSTAPLLTNDVFALYQAVNDSLLNNEDVRYIFLVEPSGDVRARTFEGGVPPDLVQANVPDPGERQRVRRLRTNEGPILDIAVPVQEGRSGVIRVGMSTAAVRGQVLSHVSDLALLVGVAVLAALALSVVVSSLLTRPIVRLSEAARRVGDGDLRANVSVDAEDELGDLADAFNKMTEDLVRSQEKLVVRNVELETLNSMADNLSRHLASERVLRTSLDHLLELTDVSAAWVCTMDPQHRMVLAAASTMVSAWDGAHAGEYHDQECGCRGVMKTGQGKAFPGAPTCPLIADAGDSGQGGLRGYAVVPLWSRSGVVGVLNVASRQPGEFDKTHLGLFASIGQQMGIALENARLYEEVERKERLRAELLDKLIGAQEDERKRIAREIHDEPSQLLSGVILRLDKLGEQTLVPRRESPQGLHVVRQEVRAAIESLHRIITELRPQALDDLGLVSAVRWYVEQRLSDSGTEVDFSVTGRNQRLAPSIETGVFRITQEAINNVAKHAKTTHVRIHLGFGESEISGEIEDEGRGFDSTSLNGGALEKAALGLLGMRERAELLGGTLTVASTLGQGTRVNFKIPITTERLNRGREDQGPDSG